MTPTEWATEDDCDKEGCSYKDVRNVSIYAIIDAQGEEGYANHLEEDDLERWGAICLDLRGTG